MNCAQHSPHSEFIAPSVNMNVVFGQIYSALHVLQLWEFMPEDDSFFFFSKMEIPRHTRPECG